MGSLFYPWHFFTFRADTHICLPGYPAGQSCTHLFPKCWAILALSWHVIVELLGLLVATELLSQQESSPRRPQVSSLPYGFVPIPQLAFE